MTDRGRTSPTEHTTLLPPSLPPSPTLDPDTESIPTSELDTASPVGHKVLPHVVQVVGLQLGDSAQWAVVACLAAVRQLAARHGQVGQVPHDGQVPLQCAWGKYNPSSYIVWSGSGFGGKWMCTVQTIDAWVVQWNLWLKELAISECVLSHIFFLNKKSETAFDCQHS